MGELVNATDLIDVVWNVKDIKGIGSWLACFRRVMDACGRLPSTREA